MNPVEENKLLKAANEKIAQLTAIIKLQQSQQFGKKTEVMEKVVAGQQSLFSDDELNKLQANDVSIAEVIEEPQRKIVRHRKKASGVRANFLNHLKQVDRVITLSETACPQCQQEMKKIGQRLYSREV